MDGNKATLIGIGIVQLATLAGVVIAAVLAYLNAGRARKWALEDREWIRIEQAAATTAQTKVIAAHTTQAVAPVAIAADRAYSEANHVNMKLEALGIEHAKTEVAIQRAITIGVEAELLRRDKLAGGR